MPEDRRTPPSSDQPALHPDTIAVRAGRPPHTVDAPLNTPITMAATYVAGGELEYGRYANPTWTAFEEALGALEGGRCLSYASGLAAVAALLDLVAIGEKVVAPRHAYNGVTVQLTNLQARGRLTASLVDIADTAAVIAACEDAAIVWLESPTNPAMEVADLPAIIAAAHAADATVVVDNTFATPLLQHPLELGADIVLHSATKFIAGHSDVVMGAVVTRSLDVYDALKAHRDLTGAVPGPFEAWLALRGLRTLPLRVERASANAAELARRLAEHPAIDEVRYPGFGGVLAVVLPSAKAAESFVHGTELWVNTTSLGGVESSFERRRRWANEPATIPEGLVRLAVGIENVEDLWRDLEAALDRSRS